MTPDRIKFFAEIAARRIASLIAEGSANGGTVTISKRGVSSEVVIKPKD